MGPYFSRFSTDALAARQYTDDQGCEAASNCVPFAVSAISLIQIGFLSGFMGGMGFSWEELFYCS